MDRLDEELVETDIDRRDADAIQTIVDSYGKGCVKYLNEVVRFHEKANIQETENTKAAAKVYGILRSGMQNSGRMPLKSYFESLGVTTTQLIHEDEKRNSKTQSLIEELKRRRIDYQNECKAAKELWKTWRARCNDAREALKNARANYCRCGRELDKLMQQTTEDSSSIGSSSDVLDHAYSMEAMDGARTYTTPASSAGTLSKRERQRQAAEQKFADAETECKEAVQVLRNRLIDRSKEHVDQLVRMKASVFRVDNALVETEERILQQERERALAEVARIDERLAQLKEYKSGSCYTEWTDDNFKPSNAVSDEDRLPTFTPYISNSYVCRDRESSASASNLPTSPTVVSRHSHALSGSPGYYESLDKRRSADILLDAKRDSVDGSSDGSTPGSTRRSHCRSSDEITQKTPESTPTEEEIRATSMAPTQQTRGSWLKSFKFWGGARGSSGGGSGSSPPPVTNDVISDVVEKCVDALDRSGLTTEGLYRKAGNEQKSRELFQDLVENPDGVCLEGHTPIDISTVLKRCFRHMRDPLFTEALHSDLVRIGKATDPEEALKELKLVIKGLPSWNFFVASIFIRHLNKVAKVEENQMSYENLGTCLAPTLLHQRNIVNLPQSAKNSQEIMANMDVKECSRVLATIIEHCEELFGKQGSNTSDQVMTSSVTRTVTSTATCQIGDEETVTSQKTVVTEIQTGPLDEATKMDGQSVTFTMNINPTGDATKSILGSLSASSTSGHPDSVLSSASSSSFGPASYPSSSQQPVRSPSPPPVPPALGHRKHSSNDKSPGRKVHEVRLRSRFSSSNTRSCNSDVFDDRLLLADVYSGTGRPSAFQMIDSSDDESSGRSYSSVFY